ncbi:helix-turn-helix domain-containing protein [Clostridium butyricum]|uniref:Putative DNA-binding protein n=1 Tax=Clostridium butyricum E4 str. BoNT E BL5262 TaxID=632245 RepID=C4IK88_CLOBU|nr:helix-turn-helix transcriptional regulator [Clostridium butyricum]APF23606.1 helix-turn-helix family protein [Clostridium butyricum]EDT75143.1 putative 4-hydroxyphenylpyruvate dioxygenase [Clostridium butyricum 5521]EEP54026.1 putative DNA-binding protein [Clostridium butyricum E4 str. BoNT E BL5262]NFL33421.1 helix-turn-helix transcriptional regulator [Clostridium butyricum]NFS19309.1 helix-turn-helix transcriptional regulator [Clostridium butyricum]
MNDVCERISTYMKINGIKQVDIATKAGLSIGFVSKIVNGKKPVSNTFLQALSEMTGKSVHYWLFGTDDYVGLASLNKLIDTFIDSGQIKDDGTYDKDIEKILKTMLDKEIKDKIKKEAQR